MSSRRTARPGKQRPNPLAISRRDDKSKMPRNARRTPNLNRGRAHATVQSFPAGGYRFISHQFQYSGGVAAEPGFRVERARFARPLPLAEGFDAIEAYLAGIGRSPTAFCACAPRRNSPTPVSLRSIGIMSSGWPPGGFFATRSTRLPARTSARKSTRPQRRRSTPSATPSRARTARRAALSPREAAKRARAAPAMKGASFGAATSRPRRCARKRVSCSGRWSSVWRRSASAGRM